MSNVISMGGKDLYYIQSRSRSMGHVVCWWKSRSVGYTIKLDLAGKYTKEQAEAICNHPNSDGDDVMHKCSVINALAHPMVDQQEIDYGREIA